MTEPSPSAAARSNNDLARIRDAMLMRLLRSHPSTVSMLLDLKLFPTRKNALRRMQKLGSRGRVRVVGTLSPRGGRPEHVYCCTAIKADNLLHEVLLTQLCLKIWADTLVRGREVDPRFRADAEFTVSGRHFFLEFDRGTMSLGDIETRRFPVYRQTEDLVLWVCTDARRMEALRERAGVLRGTALFATLDEALRDPHDSIWIDAAGGRAALPRSKTGSGTGVGGKR